MSTKALKKQLMAAIAMVLVAAVALGSSTYAWFASNKNVTAGTANITAQSDQAFLQITGTSGTYTGTSTQLNWDAGVTATLYPATHTSISGSNVVWGTAKSSDPAKVASEVSPTPIDSGVLGQYVLKTTVFVRSHGEDAANLKLTDVTVGGDSGDIDEAVRVLAVTATGNQEYSHRDTSISSGTLAATLTNDVEQAIDLYFYFEGKDESVYTNGLTATGFKAKTISLTFGVD